MFIRRALLEGKTANYDPEPRMIDMHGASWATTSNSVNSYSLRPDARRFEFWESNVAGKVAAKVAIDEALALGLQNIEAQIQSLAGDFRRLVASEGDGKIVSADKTAGGAKLGGICSLIFPNHPGGAAAVKATLYERRIVVSTSSPSSTARDAEERQLGVLLRVSFHYYNTDDDVRHVFAALKSIVDCR